MDGDFQVGAWLVQPKLNSITGGGRTAHVEPKAMQVLVYLAEHAGDVMPKERIIQAVWADTFVTDDVLTRSISELRKAFEDDPHESRFIQTIPKGGYRLIAPVAVGEHRHGAPALAQEGREGRKGPPLQLRWRLALAAIMLLALAIVLIGLNIVGLRDQLLKAVGAVREPPLRIQSIAVLPLENLSRDPEQEYFADGMTDELITNLGKISALRVISRQSTMRYKGSKKPLPEIARELNVDALVEGTVLRSGDRVRITANLLHARTDRHVWAESYERDLHDILALQSDVARAIAEEVRIKLTPEDQVRLTTTRPVNPQAYQAYLRGRLSVRKYRRDARDTALRYFNEAIQIDRNFAPAYIGLAVTYVALGHSDVLPPQEAFPKARAAALKALEIDGTVALGHDVLGTVKTLYDWDWSGAEYEFRQAEKLNPNDPDAHWGFIDYLTAVGRFDEAVAECKRGLELDPVSSWRRSRLGWFLVLARRYDEAIEQERFVLDIDPESAIALLGLGLAHAQKGDFGSAIPEMERAIELSHDKGFLGLVGYVYAVAGKGQQARQVLAQMKDHSRHNYVSPFLTAIVYAGLGESEEALRWLEKGVEQRDHDMVFLKCWPMFDALRSDPRFQDLLRRMNFPPS